MRILYYLKKGIKYVINSDARFIHSISKGNYHTEMSDIEYLSKLWRGLNGYELNWNNPKNYTEKLQWLKVFDRRPEYAKMVDKAEAKKYVSNIIGEDYIIPSYGVWDRYDDICFDDLPQQFVLKTTHDSGGIFIIKNKKEINHKELKDRINTRLNDDYWLRSRETVYEKVPHRIIAEKLISAGTPVDYKVLCFNGKAEYIEFLQGRHTNNFTQDIYDTDWNLTSYSQKNEVTSGIPVTKPRNLEKMVRLSELLSKGIPELRVDWYEVEGKLYFGELTFYDSGGMLPYTPPEFERKLGNLIDLPCGGKNGMA